MTANIERELRQLAQRWCDQALTDAEFARLEALLAAHPEARRVFVDLAQMQGELRWSFSAAATPLAQTSPAPAKRRRPTAMRWISHSTPLSLLAAGLSIALLLFAMSLWTWRGERSRIVAELIFARNVRWTPASLVDGRPPAGLAIGQTVELLQGTVALRFDSGALVMLEGPAEFGLSGRNELHLRRGQLAARVPPPAAGFLVRTATVDVIDLGTEFSVRAAEKETEVQVLKGSVHVRPRGKAGVPVRQLAAGEAVVFGNSSSHGFYTQETEMKRAIFVGLMAALAGASADLAHAQLFVRADFNDNSAVPNPTVASLNGQAGGTGFTGNWTGSNNPNVGAGDLTYANYFITQTGTPQRAQSYSTDTRQVHRALNAAMTGEIWFSVLVQNTTSSGGAGVTFNLPLGTPFDPVAASGGPTVILNDTTMNVRLTGSGTGAAIPGTYTRNTTHLILGKMNVGSGNDTLTLWMDPNLTGVLDPSGLPAATYTNSATDFAASIAQVGVAAWSGSDVSPSALNRLDALLLSNQTSAFYDVTGITQQVQNVPESSSAVLWFAGFVAVGLLVIRQRFHARQGASEK